MTNFATPSSTLSSLKTLIRAETTLANALLRIGPQPSFNIPQNVDVGIFLDLRGMLQEESIHSGNNFKNEYIIGILICVKDEKDKDEVETTRLAYLEAMQNLIASNRSLSMSQKDGYITSIELGILELDDATKQVYRFADIEVHYSTIRSIVPVPPVDPT